MLHGGEPSGIIDSDDHLGRISGHGEAVADEIGPGRISGRLGIDVGHRHRRQEAINHIIGREIPTAGTRWLSGRGGQEPTQPGQGKGKGAVSIPTKRASAWRVRAREACRRAAAEIGNDQVRADRAAGAPRRRSSRWSVRQSGRRRRRSIAREQQGKGREIDPCRDPAARVPPRPRAEQCQHEATTGAAAANAPSTAASRPDASSSAGSGTGIAHNAPATGRRCRRRRRTRPWLRAAWTNRRRRDRASHMHLIGFVMRRSLLRRGSSDDPRIAAKSQGPPLRRMWRRRPAHCPRMQRP